MDNERDIAITDSEGPHILVLSARTPSALDALSSNLADFLASCSADLQPGPPNSGLLADVAYTLQRERRSFSCRRFVVCSRREDAVAALKTPDSKKTTSGSVQQEARRPVVFLLPGIGDHYVGMGQGLYEHFSVFRQEVDRCAQILQPLLDSDVRELLYPRNRVRKEPAQSRGIDLKRMMGRVPDEPPDPAAQKLDQTIHCHPALFTLEYALARLWLHWGVRPDRIVGHSMGEYVAACLAGVLSLEDALRLVAVRAKLVNDLPLASMLAVMQPEDKLLPLLGEQLSISLINGPNLCVVAGPVAAMADFQSRLKEREIIFRPVRNAHAFHSRMLDPILDSFAREVKQVRLNAPRIPFISNVTGTWITEEQALNPFYWVDHAHRTARFSDALEQMWKLSGCLPLEVGPGRTLGVLAMQHPARVAAVNPVTLSSLRHDYENQPDADFILNSVGRLWLAGTEINWEKLDSQPGRRKISLPTCLFERQRDWIEPHTDRKSAAVGRNSSAQKTDLTDGIMSSAYVTLNASPLTPNGKADRKVSPNSDIQPSADKFAVPSTPTEIALARIWSEALELKQIGLHDNFFDIGGHSLQAMRVIVEIHKHFGKPVPMSSLFIAPTILQFSKLLDENADSTATALSEGLRGNGTGAPLFYIPQVWGYGFLPVELARHLNERCRFYDGLQYPGLNSRETMPSSIEEIADYLIPQIQRIWPHGPYYLCGWSFGGTMAFEVARQMEARGVKVQLVLLLDSDCPGARLRKRSVMEIGAVLRRRLSKLNGQERAVFLRDLAINKLRSLFSIKPNFEGKPKDETPLMKATRQAYRTYHPGSYGGRVVLFQMEDWETNPLRNVWFNGYRYAPDSTFGWGKLVRGGLEIVRVPGDHWSMISEPAVSRLAEWIRDRLDNAA
jgi:thioesterase domain-containing protein/malonyl CoA-acyl carrier protein transacylase/acyl carrier protein